MTRFTDRGERKNRVGTSEIVFQGGGCRGKYENLRFHGVS